MTIKQFAEKYDISYGTAFNASYGLTPTVSRTGSREFLEDDLRDNLLCAIYVKKKKAEETIKECNAFVKRVNKVVWSDRERT